MGRVEQQLEVHVVIDHTGAWRDLVGARSEAVVSGQLNPFEEPLNSCKHLAHDDQDPSQAQTLDHDAIQTLKAVVKKFGMRD